MVENGYLIQERSPHDRRSFHVRAAQKGLEISHGLAALFENHAERLSGAQFTSEGLVQANTTLRRLEQFWATPQHLASRLSPAA